MWTEVYKLVVSIPVILGIEVSDETIGLNQHSETVANNLTGISHKP